jgi:DEAD/DEAH box helicase domain-containing protein
VGRGEAWQRSDLLLSSLITSPFNNCQMSVNSLLSRWRSQPEVATNVMEWRTLPARPARFRDFPPELSETLRSALIRAGIQKLYLHQSSAWQAVQNGQHLVVVTGTASGKSMCYNLPVLNRLLQTPDSRALYLFPTKALAQDQAESLQNILRDINTSTTEQGVFPVKSATYDGDTPGNARRAIRSSARLVISNPDMLHAGILPHHTAWSEFFSNLEFIIVDEIHSYRGVFGSHVANVLRRLKRIARRYGAAPRFILTSATIANPEQLANRLVEEQVTVVKEDGSARGAVNFLVYNPPVLDRELGIRRSVLHESVRLAEDLLAYNVQTVIFGRARRTVEVMLSYLRERAAALPAKNNSSAIFDPNSAVRGYRGGYLPARRREIEQGLRNGSVRAVVATNALELGVDIGGMGAAILTGYPGTIASTWQQAGRAGRGLENSIAILVTSPSPLDQFLAKHPTYFFGQSPEQALINPDNLLILLAHLRCAAFELPFEPEEKYGNLETDQLKEFLNFLADQGELHHSGERYYWMADRYPAQGVSLRSTSPESVLLQVELQDNLLTIGEVDQHSAYWMVHPGAVYLHEAQSFLVEDLDLEHNLARLKAVELDYYTEPRSETQVNLLRLSAESVINGGKKQHGEVTVTSQVIGFRKIRWHTHENLGVENLDLPTTNLHTTAYWLALSDETVEKLASRGLWTNSPNDYGPSWPALRNQRRALDNFRCQVCGAPERGRSHDVHHKIPFRAFVNAEQANQLTNLVTLCSACHHRTETAVRMRSGLAGLSHVIGQLAPLFLMCDARDLGVHSDPQSLLADARPAVVIYDQVPDGIGFSQRLFELHDELVQRAYELVDACECADGCPSCVGPGGENGSGGKRESIAILEALARV